MLDVLVSVLHEVYVVVGFVSMWVGGFEYVVIRLVSVSGLSLLFFVVVTGFCLAMCLANLLASPRAFLNSFLAIFFMAFVFLQLNLHMCFCMALFMFDIICLSIWLCFGFLRAPPLGVLMVTVVVFVSVGLPGGVAVLRVVVVMLVDVDVVVVKVLAVLIILLLVVVVVVVL
jgi:hypothetical protein